MSTQFYNEAKTLYKYIANQLSNLYDIQEAKNISRILLLDILELSPTEIVLNAPIQPSYKQIQQIEKAILRLLKNEPLQYITGKCFFHGFEFTVNSDVLIPRPETEELVDLVLKNRGNRSSILDIGTGSGCIAISLSKMISGSNITALDVDKKALKTAILNANALKANVNFIELDVLTIDKLDSTFDIIVSNPPYVLITEKEKMLNNVKLYEPSTALFVPTDKPLLFYQKIAHLAKKSLHEEGILFFEIHEEMGKPVKRMLNDIGFQNVIIVKDLQGKDRMAMARFK